MDSFSNKIYLTTTLPYVNAEPHIGFALEAVRADVWARWQRQQGREVFFNTGADEHGLKIFRRAQELGLAPQAYCDAQTEKWLALKEALDLSYDNFIRTTSPQHQKAAQEFWRRSRDNGFIYKKKYKIKYCVGCELKKTDSELVGDRCPYHPGQELEIIEEDNYFFRFSQFQNNLLRLYEERPNFVAPQHRFNEVKKFVQMGLEDFSVSRLKTKMPWGISVPDDDEQVMYVWFDALINYISAIGWPEDSARFNDWWPVTQVAGKDNVRQQAAMWQAMLMSVGLPPSRQIFINSFLTSGGQKMSKSLGNVILPQELVEKFGVDGTRYLLASLDTFGEDMDIAWEAMADKYNSDLANGLGNLVSRVVKLSQNLNVKAQNYNLKLKSIKIQDLSAQMQDFKLKEALEQIWQPVAWANKYVDETRAWELIKNEPEKAREVLSELLGSLAAVADAVAPFMPRTADKIQQILKAGEVKEVLFPRVSF